MNGNTDGHGIADYPARARLCFTEAVSVLLETHQSGTNALLQSMFTCACFSAVRDNISDLVGCNHRCGLSQSGTSDSFTSVPSYESFACFCSVMWLYPEGCWSIGIRLQCSHIEAFIFIAHGGRVTWKTREYQLCRDKTAVTGHFVDSVQTFAENHIHRFSA